MRWKLAAAALSALLLLSGCAAGGGAGESAAENAAPAREAVRVEAAPGSVEAVSRSFYAMDTLMSLRAYNAEEADLAAAEDWIAALEAQISVTREDSRTYLLNSSGAASFDGAAFSLLRQALALCRETDGALDLTVYPIVRAWGFTDGAYRVPDDAELAALLETVDYSAVELSADGGVHLPAGAQLDLGAVAKGYAGDCLCGMLRAEGVESAILDLGGNIQTIGGKPDGSDWKIGIRDPQGEGLLGTVSARDCAVITSGGYERYFTDDSGRIRWHIMDPAIGKPAENGLCSVTVMGAEGLRCDGLSTALFVMGEEGAVAFWRAHRDVGLALVTQDGRLLLTPGMAARFTPDRGCPYEIEQVE